MRTYNDISTLEWYRPLEINSIDVCSSRTCQILYIHLRTETKATSNFRVLVSWVHSDVSPPLNACAYSTVYKPNLRMAVSDRTFLGRRRVEFEETVYGLHGPSWMWTAVPTQDQTRGAYR